MNTQGQTLKIFLVDGTVQGLKITEKSNWVGQCLSCSRAQFQTIKKTRGEYKKTGVYLLYGYDEIGLVPNIYIGEGDPVLDRLNKHENEKDFWQSMAVFTNKDSNLNKAHVQYLEARLIKMAIDARSVN